MQSKYAAAVRALYAHPVNGTQVFRVSPDRSRDPASHEPVAPGTEAERAFRNIWQTAPAALRVWACGRLATTSPEAAAELLEDTPPATQWRLNAGEAPCSRYRSQRGRPLDLDEVDIDDDGNVIDGQGDLVELGE